MSDPRMIREIINAVSIPVMAKVRIGHMVEAQVRETSSLKEAAAKENAHLIAVDTQSSSRILPNRLSSPWALITLTSPRC